MHLQAIAFKRPVHLHLYLPVYTIPTDQLHLPLSLHLLDGYLSLHRGRSIWKFLYVDQLYRSAGPGIPRAAPLVVNDNPFLRVHRPSGVVSTVGALDDIAIEAHLTYAVFADLS